MTEYQQADTLYTDTNVAFAGSGSASPVAPDGGSDYTAWQWEVVLATVLGIAIPGRAEITGQPWLTIEQNGQGGAGLHLIWTASWDTKPSSGGASLQAYLNPGVYTTGGAWDQFVSTPSGPMSAAASKAYGGLPLDPGTFGSASAALADATSMLGSVAQQFADIRSQAMTDNSGFHGNMADVVAQLLGDLGATAQSLHDQMTTPTSYSGSVSSAGDAGAVFLSSLESAYNGWLAVPEHSPLGAIVQVLKQIATQDSSGAYVIANPQQTPYGDLTTPTAWSAVEQQAKNLWTGALTGDSDFAGLDPLARSALSNLVSQYETTTSAIVPVIGPAPPRPKPKPAGGQTGAGGKSAKNKSNGFGGGSGSGGGTGGGSGKAFVVTTGPGAGGPGPGSGSPGPGSGVRNDVVALLGSGAGGGGNGASSAAPPPGHGSLPGGGNGPGGGAAAVVVPATAALGAGAAIGAGEPGPGSSRLGDSVAAALPGVPRKPGGGGPVGAVLSGAIGALASLPRSQTAAAADPGAVPIGVLGLSEKERNGRRRSRRKAGTAAGELLAPGADVGQAGIAIGRAAASPQLGRLAVTSAGLVPVASSPRSGQVNTELVPASVPAPSAAAGQVSQAASAEGANASALGPDGQPLMLMPGLGVGGLQRDQERHRLAYLPQDEEYWGTDPRAAVASIGAHAIADPLEQDFEPGPALARIRADQPVTNNGQTRPDGRNP